MSAHSPSYYIKKRLFANKSAVFGLCIIILASIVAILGYAIMPDDTPNANDGAVEIKKKPPMFSTLVLKTTKAKEVEDVNFFVKMWVGEESPYKIEPILSYDFLKDSLSIRVAVLGGKGKITRTESIIPIVYPLYAGASNELGGKKWKVKVNIISYLDIKGKVQKVDKSQTINHFVENHIEERRYWLGTDISGRDLLSELIFGTRISLSIGFIAVIISMFVGIVIGSIAGFFRGWVDDVMMWIMTVVWAVPGIMLVIAISLALNSKGVWVAFVAVGLTMWVEVARVIRGQILEIREKQFVEAARALGMSNLRIIFKHILPNTLGPMIVVATANFAAAILIEAGLSFLGLGVQPPTPSWGTMVHDGYLMMTNEGSAHLIIFPSLCISILVLAFNLLGNGLRDAFDPKN
ncbi:MAG: ABC transporter permease [Cytophagales bacterium]|nr:ABC transporter permease [Cytophagales bacterium]